ncbi:hypothetical protein DPMN_108823 [Dreissena polymorpha]|uniref:Uncharacterized protein n=1 Tax=Dreissena polymorpha TaxID=45954 RepID=A0A9D4K970_DREPO|nr:hypothetical protein DPMN_108823 [Dreissena polymorpha]
MAERIAWLLFLLDGFADNSEIDQIGITNFIAYDHLHVLPGLNFNFKGQHITDIRNSVKLWHHVWYVSAQCLLEKGYWNKQRDSTIHSHFNM